MPPSVLLDWIELVHDEHGQEDDGEYSEMNPEPIEGICDVPFYSARLEVNYALLSSF